MDWTVWSLSLFSVVLLLSQKQSLEELRQTVQLLRCSEAKLMAQRELLEQKMQENEGKEPPPVVNYEEDARSVNSMVRHFVGLHPKSHTIIFKEYGGLEFVCPKS